MKHLSIDEHDEQIKEFVRSLPVEPEGVELELDGRVVCKVFAPHQLSDTERDAVLRRGWERIRMAGERNQDVPAKEIEREVQEAVNEVRMRTRSRCSLPCWTRMFMSSR
jgi:hypothetical protein